MPRSAESTALHELVADQHAPFEQIAAAEGSGLPRFVSEAFRRFMRCGVLAHGFARFRCAVGRHEHLVLISARIDQSPVKPRANALAYQKRCTDRPMWKKTIDAYGDRLEAA